MEILIILIIVLVVVFIVVASSGSKKTTSNNTVEQTTITNQQVDKTNSYKKNTNTAPRKDMLDFLEFDKIADDMIIQDKGNKYTMVIQCKGINYDLMSEIEQLSVEEGFINFLSTLRFPIQLYVQARTIDMKKSINMYKEKVKTIADEYNEKNEIYKNISSDLNAKDDEIKLAEYEKEKLANINDYANDITRYVERLSLNKQMLQRKFYVIISYYKSEISSSGHFNKDELHEICNTELYTRAQTIISSLQSSSVSARVLTSNEIAELLYISYNRDDEKLMDIKSALDSGFYRMYSTSKDVYEKKEELMQKQIEEDAMLRIKLAVEEARANGTLQSRDNFIEEYETAVDTRAVHIVENSDMDANTKRNIQNQIIETHNKEFEEREKERAEKVKTNKQEVEKIEVETEIKQEVKPEEKKESKNEKIIEKVEVESENSADDSII